MVWIANPFSQRACLALGDVERLLDIEAAAGSSVPRPRRVNLRKRNARQTNGLAGKFLTMEEATLVSAP
jgi:hypothetical protein